MELALRYYGDRILRQRAEEVVTFDANLREEAESMAETMYRLRGIGLAGPQVGLHKRLLIALKMSDSDDEDAARVVLVNPVITERSKETWVFEEGCLSIPGINGDVTRAERITVQFQDLEGQTLVVEAEGMFARVVQHEIDHLNGKLFIDYISEASKSLIKPKLKEIAERYS